MATFLSLEASDERVVRTVDLALFTVVLLRNPATDMCGKEQFGRAPCGVAANLSGTKENFLLAGLQMAPRRISPFQGRAFVNRSLRTL